MDNLPLHPAIVHVPIGLSVAGPILAFAILILVRTGKLPRIAYALGAAMQIMAAGGAWVALETGEDEEERVEDSVPEALIEEHEELAEAFAWTSTASVIPAVAAVALAGPAGSVAAIAWTGLTLVDLGLALAVGHAGGEIAYGQGAVSNTAPATLGGDPRAAMEKQEEGEDDDD